MRMKKWQFAAVVVTTSVAGITYAQKNTATWGPDPKLPPPVPAEVKNFSQAGKWAPTAKPKAPNGFRVTRFAEGLVSPRWLYVLPDGDVLVAEGFYVRVPN